MSVTLDDVKAYLNIKGATSDDELVGFLDDAVAAVEDVIGPLSPVTVVEEFDAHGPNIVLSQTPVQSVQSVSIEPWLGAAAIDDTTAWRLNTMTGVLRRKVVGGSLPYYGPGSIFTVTYTAGRSNVSSVVERAIKMQVREMWRSQRGAQPTQSADDNPPPSYPGAYGFLAPAVMELLSRHLQAPGVA